MGERADTGPVLDVNDLLQRMVDTRASDLHLRVGARPTLRIDGRLEPAGDVEVTGVDTETLARQLIPPHRRPEWERDRQIDFAYGLAGVGRFRVTVYAQRGTVALAVRNVLPGIPPLESLNLPPAIHRFAGESNGLVLVTGPAGAGKTTTVAALLDRVNETEQRHIVTVEDPIEFLHRDRRSIVTQREIGADCPDYRTALNKVMRQDPDVVFIGEIAERDLARHALMLAGTGRLVISTVLGASVAQILEWFVNLFPPADHATVRGSLARTLRGVVCQKLIERTDGRGRVPAVEVLVTQSRVVDFLLQDPTAAPVEQIMAEGEYYGMQTFDQCLYQLCKGGLISLREAVTASAHPHELRAALQSLGLPISADEL